MAYNVHLVSKTFTSEDGTELFGYKILDNYGNWCEDFLDKPIPNNMDLLKTVVKANIFSKNRDETTAKMLNYAKIHGLIINNYWYEPEEIAHLFNG